MFPKGRQLSIGAVSKATGVPVDTLRTWERRYGFPTPERTPGGHRLYPPETVEAIRIYQRALDAGHRPAQIIGAPIDEVGALVGGARVVDDEQALAEVRALKPASGEVDPKIAVADWLKHVENMDRTAFDAGMREVWSRRGLLRFLADFVAPFLREIGNAWALGKLSVAHEHFASERLRDFLSSIWSPLASQNSGPRIVATTLPGEFHDLGLHMAAAVCALSGLSPVFLGASTPIPDVVESAARTGSQAVLVSVSQAMSSGPAQQELGKLRELLPPEVSLVVGGEGAPEGFKGVVRIGDLEDLWSWALAKTWNNAGAVRR